MAQDTEYFEQRQLKKGVAGWVLLVGLGVAYVISGDYAGWNFGLGQGGWGGLLIATFLMAVMYLFMVLGLAELSAAISTAGGGYAFARRAMGPWGGFLTGTAILIEYAIAPAAIANFIGAYVNSLIGIHGWIVYLVFYLVFVGLHLYGVGEAMKAIFVITAIAVFALIVFLVAASVKFNAANLTNIPVSGAAGASKFLPFGYVGIWAAIPYGIWFFLAVEGVPLAAEETKNPAKDMPKGIIGAMLILLVFAAAIGTVAPAASGADILKASGNPLVEALVAPHAYNGQTLVSRFVNLVGLLGLIASFFSIIYAYSRQTFALSRAGYLPKILARTSRRKTPVLALMAKTRIVAGQRASWSPDGPCRSSPVSSLTCASSIQQRGWAQPRSAQASSARRSRTSPRESTAICQASGGTWVIAAFSRLPSSHPTE